MKIEIEEYLDKTLENFFPQQGNWKSSCFSKSKELEEINLPCHIRDDSWLADLIIKKYNLDFSKKNVILDYIVTSKQFNKLRYEYEQRIVSWQINWMNNGGENWIIDQKLGGDLYLFSPKCDYAFRKGIVDTLLAIGMDIDAIEEGIEKNANKWRENHMKIAFHNLYSVLPTYSLSHSVNENNILEKPSQEHYEKWLKLRLYEYYIEHKDSVDKYGEVLPEMKMTESEVIELKKWLEVAHEERIKKILEFKNKDYSSNIPKMKEINFYDCDVLSTQELEEIKYSQKSDKINESLKLDLKTWLLHITKALKTKHDNIDFKTENSINDEKNPNLKKKRK